MSAMYETDVTLEINGLERDFEVRGYVDTEMTSRGTTAFVEGTVEVRCRGGWTDIDDVRGLTSESRGRAFEALEEMALEDDSDDCAADMIGDMEREEMWA
jgi:hypothetical protein